MAEHSKFNFHLYRIHLNGFKAAWYKEREPCKRLIKSSDKKELWNSPKPIITLNQSHLFRRFFASAARYFLIFCTVLAHVKQLLISLFLMQYVSKESNRIILKTAEANKKYWKLISFQIHYILIRANAREQIIIILITE